MFFDAPDLGLGHKFGIEDSAHPRALRYKRGDVNSVEETSILRTKIGQNGGRMRVSAPTCSLAVVTEIIRRGSR